MYGAIANKAFRYHNRSIAEGITMTGQLIIRTAVLLSNRFLNDRFKTENEDYIIGCDTDSIFLNLGPFISTFGIGSSRDLKLEKVHKVIDLLNTFVERELKPAINKGFIDLQQRMNASVNLLDMKREVLADVAIIRKRKNYIMQVYDLEGVRFTKPEIKAMGIEVIKSSTPKFVQKGLLECLKILMNGTEKELHSEIDRFREEFYSVDLTEIAAPKGVSDIYKWIDHTGNLKKGTPVHSRAAINYNRLLKHKGIGNIYPEIMEGNKLRYVYLKVPNPTQEYVVGFIDHIPAEFEITDYVDRDKHWEKLFLAPMKSFTDIINWQIALQKDSLDDLFN